jgi:hypothetical protein
MLFLMFQRLWSSLRWPKLPVLLSVLLVLVLTGCGLPQVSAESRLFLNLSLDWVSQYTMPQTTFAGTAVGGFSGLTYDRQQDRFYALVDDSTQPRYYTLQLHMPVPESANADLVSLEAVTLLEGQTTPDDPPQSWEGASIALTPQDTLFIASAGDGNLVPPRLSEFQRRTGQWQQNLPLPKHYWAKQEDGTVRLGPTADRSLTALTTTPDGERLFTATAGPLRQDVAAETDTENPRYSRFLHYWIGEPEPILVAEYLYPLGEDGEQGDKSQLSEIVPVDSAGHFLSLEKKSNIDQGDSAIIYEIATGVAADTTKIDSLLDSPKYPAAIRKKALFDLSTLHLSLQNLRGMMLGPYFPDGTRSLLLVSDNRLNAQVPTQWLLLRLSQHPQQVTSGRVSK